MLRGRISCARDHLAGAQAGRAALEPRDDLFARALEVGLARRSSDVPALVRAWERAREAVLRYPIDLFTLLPLGELMIAAARLHDVRPAAAARRRGRRPAAPAGRSAAVGHPAALERRAGGDPRRRPGRARAARGGPGGGGADQPVRGHAGPGRPLLAARPHRRHRRAAVLAAAEDWPRSGWPGTARGWPGRPPPGPRTPAAARRCCRAPGRWRRTTTAARPCRGGRRSRRAPAPAPEGGSASASGRWRALVEGQTYREIGGRLFISAKTVEHHVSRMRQRLGAGTRSDLLARLRAEIAEGA